MITYLIACGIGAHIILALFAIGFLWLSFIRPLFEAISMARWSREMHNKHPYYVKKVGWAKLVYHHYEAFGRNWQTTRCRAGEWHGIGKWEVYNFEEEE